MNALVTTSGFTSFNAEMGTKSDGKTEPRHAFLRNMFQPTLKIFQKWNNIPAKKTAIHAAGQHNSLILLVSSHTYSKLYRVKVKHKGQVTVPAHIRKKMKLDEGALLEVEELPEGILLKPLSGIKPGKPVGQKEYKKIITELDQLRSEWR